MTQRTRTQHTYSQNILVAVGLLCFIFGLAAGILWSTGKFSFRVTTYTPPTRQASVLAVATDIYEGWFESWGPANVRNERIAVETYERIPADQRGEGGPRVVSEVAVYLSYPETSPLYLDHVAYIDCYRHGLFVECTDHISFQWTPQEAERQAFTSDAISELWGTEGLHFVSVLKEEAEEEGEAQAEDAAGSIVEGWWQGDALRVVHSTAGEVTREEIWAEGEYCRRRGETDDWTCREEREVPEVLGPLHSMLSFEGLNRGGEVTSASLHNDTLDGELYRVYEWREDVRAGGDTASCQYELWVNESSQRPARLRSLGTTAGDDDVCRRGLFSGEVTAFADFDETFEIELPELEEEEDGEVGAQKDADETGTAPAAGEDDSAGPAEESIATADSGEYAIPARCEGVLGEPPAGTTLTSILADVGESIDETASLAGRDRAWGGFVSEGDLHAWTFNGCAGQLVTVDVMATEDEPTDPYILLIAPNDVLVGEDDDSGADFDARLMSYLPMSGTYTLVIGNYTAGDYEILLSWEEPGASTEAELQVGIEAEVRTTEGDTMRIREQASLTGRIVTYVANRAVVTIIDGPQEADGLRWWKVRTRSGYEGWIVDYIDGVETLRPR